MGFCLSKIREIDKWASCGNCNINQRNLKLSQVVCKSIIPGKRAGKKEKKQKHGRIPLSK